MECIEHRRARLSFVQDIYWCQLPGGRRAPLNVQRQILSAALLSYPYPVFTAVLVNACAIWKCKAT